MRNMGRTLDRNATVLRSCSVVKDVHWVSDFFLSLRRIVTLIALSPVLYIRCQAVKHIIGLACVPRQRQTGDASPIALKAGGEGSRRYKK
jgi:hypothetical protein